MSSHAFTRYSSLFYFSLFSSISNFTFNSFCVFIQFKFLFYFYFLIIKLSWKPNSLSCLIFSCYWSLPRDHFIFRLFLLSTTSLYNSLWIQFKVFLFIYLSWKPNSLSCSFFSHLRTLSMRPSTQLCFESFISMNCLCDWNQKPCFNII